MVSACEVRSPVATHPFDHPVEYANGAELQEQFVLPLSYRNGAECHLNFYYVADLNTSRANGHVLVRPVWNVRRQCVMV